MTRVPGQVILILMCWIFSVQVSYGVDRVQEVSLKKGWNAVYLEVDPLVEGQNISSFIFSEAQSNNAIPIRANA